jgi:hypothetical protein
MTTLKLTGGCLGSETMMVRCNLSDASALVQVDYMTGNGWEATQYQCADAKHLMHKLAEIGQELAERACEARGECNWDIVRE